MTNYTDTKPIKWWREQIAAVDEDEDSAFSYEAQDRAESWRSDPVATLYPKAAARFHKIRGTHIPEDDPDESLFRGGLEFAEAVELDDVERATTTLDWIVEYDPAAYGVDTSELTDKEFADALGEAFAEHRQVCTNCEQYIHIDTRDCLNECRKRGLTADPQRTYLMADFPVDMSESTELPTD